MPARLGPSWSCGSSGFGGRTAGSAGSGFGRHGITLRCSFVYFRENDIILIIVLGQQRSYFAKFFRGLLEHLDLFAKLGVFCLLLPQDLMDVFHTTPYWQSKDGRVKGSTVIPAVGLRG